MAVYTDVSDHELQDFVSHYDIGAVVACKGIAAETRRTAAP